MKVTYLDDKGETKEPKGCYGGIDAPWQPLQNKITMKMHYLIYSVLLTKLFFTFSPEANLIAQKL